MAFINPFKSFDINQTNVENYGKEMVVNMFFSFFFFFFFFFLSFYSCTHDFTIVHGLSNNLKRFSMAHKPIY